MTTTAPSDDFPPLRGVRVVDLADGALGAIGRTLCELGAEVIRVEPPGGADRGRGRMVRGVSLDFAAANLGKASVLLDLGQAGDRAAFQGLAASADLLIETTSPGSPEAANLQLDVLRRANPQLVVLSLSAFGAGAFEAWAITDPVLHALTGELSRSGIPGRPPLLPPGELALQCAAAQAAYVLLAAYLNRLQTGRGDHLEMSLIDAASQALDPGYGIAGSAAAGRPAGALPRGRPEARQQYPILPCADGFVRICVLAARQWQGMFEWMGRPAAFADPSYNDLRTRFECPNLIPAITQFFADKGGEDLEAAGRRFGVPAARVFSLAEAMDTEHMAARQAFTEVALAPGLSAPFPNGLLELDGVRMGPTGPAPAPGEHQALLASATARPAAAATTTRAERSYPLAGLRVLDLGVIVVGAEQGRLLADLGAEVIKVENPLFPDLSRATARGGVSPAFVAGHRNKRSVCVNLREPRGRGFLLKLAETADVVLSNFKPGTMESLGLDAEALRAHNPRLIVADSSAFGPTGPWSGRMGYGPLVRAAAGLTSMWRYPDEPASFSDAMTVYPDHVAARVGAAGVLALLIRRRRAGEGGSLSISQAEVMLGQMAAETAASALTRRGEAVGGNGQDAPWGVFPCAGDDEWCAVTVRDTADWRGLCRAMGREDLAGDPRLADRAGRAAERDRVEAALTAWLATRPPLEAMGELQAAGVPAGAMLRVADLPGHPHFQARGLFQTIQQPGFDQPQLVDHVPARSERLAPPPLGPAPLLGQHSAEIAREIAGLTAAEIDKLFDAEVLSGPRAPDAAPAKPRETTA